MALPAPGYLSNAERTNAEMNQALEDQRDFIAGIVGAVATLTASAALTADQLGLALIDATSGNVTATLPASDAALGVRDVIVRRIDGSANSATISANAAEKIMLDTESDPSGQASAPLLHRDDWLHLRSDGAGRWWVVGSSAARASETHRGALRVGTQAEVDAGEMDSVAVTPKKLRWGFTASWGTNGYIVFPSWLMGFILQWGTAVTDANGLAVFTFPLAFPNAAWNPVCSVGATTRVAASSVVEIPTVNSCRAWVSNSAGAAFASASVRFLILGR